ncbi:MAG: hypothetical protein H0W71_07710 [Sphingomonas sp.]|nr:hypothetical protein [Sphingomonas sp.]
MDDEALWRKRFLMFMVVRLAGLAVFFLGVAIAYFDILRPGGWPQVGAIIAILGAMDAIFAPRLLKTLWEREQK